MKIKGVITFVPLSGGFWGITSKGGQRFRPIDPLPSQFQHEGMSVEVTVETVEVFSIFMWGRDVKVKTIHSVPAS